MSDLSHVEATTSASPQVQVQVQEEEKERYREVLRESWKKPSQNVIPNLYPWHSREATKQLFEYATSGRRLGTHGKIVRILTGSLPDYVYDDVMYDKIRKYVETDGQVRILVWNTTMDDVGGGDLHDLCSGTKRLSICLSGTKDLSDELPHFVVVDDSAFRLENPHESVSQSDVSETSPRTPAMICFDNTGTGSKLSKMFDSLWESCSVKSCDAV